MRLTASHVARFLFLCALQVFFLKNIGYYNLSVPFVYILFILRLPIQTRTIYLYSYCLITGLVIDAFYNTMGAHAAACIVAGFVRHLYLNFSVQQDKFDANLEPNISNFDVRWFLLYAGIVMLAHHFALFGLEIFKWNALGFIITRSILSSFFGVFLIMVIELLALRIPKSGLL